jgi:uncharacterized protein (DUF169 family)
MTHLDRQTFRHPASRVPDLGICPIIIIRTNEATKPFNAVPAVIEFFALALRQVVFLLVEIAKGSSFGYMYIVSVRKKHLLAQGCPGPSQTFSITQSEERKQLMKPELIDKIPKFLEILGLEEEPMGIFYTDTEPGEGFSPNPSELPTRQREIRNEINWQEVFGRFSCVMGNIWRARKKKTAAYFSAERFGCPGGAFWLGFMKPQSETIIHYVSSGIPELLPGEFYCESPDELRRIFDYVDPRPAPRKFCVVKPVSQFAAAEVPELVCFFARPEVLCGLHQLATFVTNNPTVVASPWGAACGNLVVWPLKYLARGEARAVLGGWDPSARKFFKTDELSLSVPFEMFCHMLERYGQSFLNSKTWQTVRKKIERSKKAWGAKAAASDTKES